MYTVGNTGYQRVAVSADYSSPHASNMLQTLASEFLSFLGSGASTNETNPLPQLSLHRNQKEYYLCIPGHPASDDDFWYAQCMKDGSIGLVPRKCGTYF